jgi:tetratricopeptide (TPR) repeat protein
VWAYSLVDLVSNNNLRRAKIVVENKFNKVYLRGLAFYLKGEYIRAIRLFELLFKKNNKDSDVVFQLAKSYAKVGNTRLTRKMLEKYFEFDTKGKWQEEAKNLFRWTSE